MKIYIKDRKELTNHEVKKILELLLLVWPLKNETPNIEKIIKGYKNENSFHKVLLYYNEKELIGHTEVFHHEIIYNSKVIPILALAGVCVNNRFINSKSKTDVNLNPWRDPNVMIYPNTYEIGDNIIDLNGECY